MSLTSNKIVQVLFVVAAVLSIVVAFKTLKKGNCKCNEDPAPIGT